MAKPLESERDADGYDWIPLESAEVFFKFLTFGFKIAFKLFANFWWKICVGGNSDRRTSVIHETEIACEMNSPLRLITLPDGNPAVFDHASQWTRQDLPHVA